VPLSSSKLDRDLNKILLQRFKKAGDIIEKIEFSQDYETPKGKGGFEYHSIYTFNGIRLFTKTKDILTLMKGDYANLPKVGKCKIDGFEVNLTEKREFYDAFFTTNPIFSLEDLNSKNFKVCQKFKAVHLDVSKHKGSQVEKAMYHQKNICSKVKLPC